MTANVSWTVSDNQTWLSTSATSGSGNGSFTVNATANTGTASRSGTVTVTGGGLTRTIAVTQAAPSANNLTLSASTWAPAAAAASTPVTVTGNVSWTVTDDQSWLSASPTSGSGNGSFTLSATANTGTTSRTRHGDGERRRHHAHGSVTQAGVSTGGSVTATGVVTSSSGWFSEEQVRVNNTANITALTVTISVQRTAGVNAAGQYNTVGGQITQSNSCTTTVCTYVFTLSSGQTLTPGNGRIFAAQMSGNGTVHPTAGDTFTVTGTAGGSPSACRVPSRKARTRRAPWSAPPWRASSSWTANYCGGGVVAGAPAPPGELIGALGGELGAGAGLGIVGLGPGTVGLGLGIAGEGPGTPPGDGAELPGAGAPEEPGGGRVSDGGVPIGGDVLGGGSALPGTAFPGAGAAGASAGTDCGGTVGPAAGVTLCTATRTFSMSESTSSSVKLGRPRGSLTSTFAPSPSCTL